MWVDLSAEKPPVVMHRFVSQQIKKNPLKLSVHLKCAPRVCGSETSQVGYKQLLFNAAKHYCANIMCLIGENCNEVLDLFWILQWC